MGCGWVVAGVRTVSGRERCYARWYDLVDENSVVQMVMSWMSSSGGWWV